DGDGFIEDLLLLVGILGQDKQRLGVEGSQDVWVGALGGGRDPGFVLAEEIPDRPEEGRRHRLEVEVQNDEGPAGAVVVREGLLDDGSDALEEIGPEVGLPAGDILLVRYHDSPLAGGPVDIPREVLLDTNGEAGPERTVDAVGPFALVRVAV